MESEALPLKPAPRYQQPKSVSQVMESFLKSNSYASPIPSEIQIHRDGIGRQAET